MENTSFARVMALFREVSAIPRPSHHEERIADYIENFAKANGCEVYRDDLNNVFVRVAATAGYEDRAPILLQGHTDMVCEKNADVEHDFMKDGIKIIEENGFLRADGTTLGADDGVAVALMLYVIEGGVPAHGEIECLFTATEETGLYGVQGFDFSRVHARRMINIDGGGETVVTVGCAGGVTSDILFATRSEPIVGTPMRISVRGLTGGHSGSDINKGRANANLLLTRLLCEMYTALPLSLVSFNGGDKSNAIPREADAVIAVEDCEEVRTIASRFEKAIRTELSAEDAGFSLTVSVAEGEEKTMLDARSTRAVLSFLATVKCGVLAMSAALPGLVEYSKNLAVVRTSERGVVVTVSSRSAIERQLEEAMRELDILASLTSAFTKHRDRYPGWSYAGESPIADLFDETIRTLHGKETLRKTIHAGLECGIIKGRIPDMDAISVGPSKSGLHSVEEKLDIASYERFTATLLTLLQNA